jgi:MFS family permease
VLQVSGLGALVLTPVVGNLSDRYGRKALLALPATASIVPLGKSAAIYL